MPSSLRRRFMVQAIVMGLFCLLFGFIVMLFSFLTSPNSQFLTLAEVILFTIVMVAFASTLSFLLYTRFVNKIFFKKTINRLQFFSAAMLMSTIVLWFVNPDWKNAESIAAFFGFLVAGVTYAKSELKISTDEEELAGFLQLFSYEDDYLDVVGALITNDQKTLDSIYEKIESSPEEHSLLLKRLKQLRHSYYEKLIKDNRWQKYFDSLSDIDKDELHQSCDNPLKHLVDNAVEIKENTMHPILFRDMEAESNTTNVKTIIPPDL